MTATWWRVLLRQNAIPEDDVPRRCAMVIHHIFTVAREAWGRSPTGPHFAPGGAPFVTKCWCLSAVASAFKASFGTCGNDCRDVVMMICYGWDVSVCDFLVGWFQIGVLCDAKADLNRRKMWLCFSLVNVFFILLIKRFLLYDEINYSIMDS